MLHEVEIDHLRSGERARRLHEINSGKPGEPSS